jgi:hypothetical protein
MPLLYTTLPSAGTAARGAATLQALKERRFALYLLRE